MESKLHPAFYKIWTQQIATFQRNGCISYCFHPVSLAVLSAKTFFKHQGGFSKAMCNKLGVKAFATTVKMDNC